MSKADRVIRIALVATDRSDLLCIACGRFTQRERSLAISPRGLVAGGEPQAAVHVACLPQLRVKFEREPAQGQAHQPEREDGP